MRMLDHSEMLDALVVSILLIVAGYQFYFLPQRMPMKEASIGTETDLDKKIEFRPWWVWIYSFAYYPYILSTILTLSSVRQFYLTCVSYIVLLLSHVVISYILPVRTPSAWRTYNVGQSPSKWFLKFIQRIDKGGNCFPSMHVAVATLTAIHITMNGYSEAGLAIFSIWIIPALISASALFTKQHFIADIPPGFFLALVVYCLYRCALAYLIGDNLIALLVGAIFLGVAAGLLLVCALRIFFPDWIPSSRSPSDRWEATISEEHY